MFKAIKASIVLVVTFLIAAYLYGYFSQPRLASDNYVRIWTTENMQVLKIIEEPALVSKIQSHWIDKESVETSSGIEFNYLIDGIIERRLQYSNDGYVRVLSVKSATPIYRLSNPESFNDLILTSAE